MSSDRLRNSILAARDRRQALTGRHLPGSHPSLLTLSLNIPGSDKNLPGCEALFTTFFEKLKLSFPGLTVLERENGLLGPWCLLAPGLGPDEAKRACVGLEESLPAGRLIDLDVYDRNGKQIGRRELGLPERGCLLCGQPAVECIRLKRHSFEQLSVKIDELLHDYRIR